MHNRIDFSNHTTNRYPHAAPLTLDCPQCGIAIQLPRPIPDQTPWKMRCHGCGRVVTLRLKNSVIGLAKRFTRLLSCNENRRKWRDYTLFALGVVAAAVVGVLVQWLC